MFERRLRTIPSLVVTLLICSGLCSALPAAPTTVWQIGTFDQSSREFASGTNPATGQPINYYDPAEDPVFVVGTSSAKNWF